MGVHHGEEDIAHVAGFVSLAQEMGVPAGFKIGKPEPLRKWRHGQYRQHVFA